MSKATIEDVALLANVSVSTADRVLNARGGVNPDKEHRVLDAARRLKIDRILSRSHARTMRIAVLIQAATNPFHAALRDGFATANTTYADVNLQFLIHHIDPNLPHRTAAVIAKAGIRYDGLIVTSPGGPIIVEALRHVAAMIPVVTLATDISDSGRHVYVGPDDRQAGRVAGDLMGRFLGSAGGDVLMIAGLLTIAGHREREAGFRAVLEEHYPRCCLVAVLESREEAERAAQLVGSALDKMVGLRGIYHASVGAEAIVLELSQSERSDIVFITHELTEDRRALLKARAIHAVVDQNASTEAYVAAKTMAQLLGRLEGEPFNTITPVQIFTSENS